MANPHPPAGAEPPAAPPPQKKKEPIGATQMAVAVFIGVISIGGASWTFYAGNNPLNAVVILGLGGFLALRLGGVLKAR